MFRQKRLSSSVNYCTKRWKLNYIVSRTMLIKMNSDNYYLFPLNVVIKMTETEISCLKLRMSCASWSVRIQEA